MPAASISGRRTVIAVLTALIVFEAVRFGEARDRVRHQLAKAAH